MLDSESCRPDPPRSDQSQAAPTPRPNARFVADLRRICGRAADGPVGRVPDSISHELASLARARWRGQRIARVLRVALPLSAAAALLIAVSAWLSNPLGRERTLARGDIDANGTIDIRDARRLALAIDRGQVLELSMDLNRDGIVDQTDVDQIGERSVRLKEAR